MFIKVENGQPVGLPITDENMRYILPMDLRNTVLTSDILRMHGYAFYSTPAHPVLNDGYEIINDGYDWDGEKATHKWKIQKIPDEVIQRRNQMINNMKEQAYRDIKPLIARALVEFGVIDKNPTEIPVEVL